MTTEEKRIALAEVLGWTGHCDRCSQGTVEHFDGEGEYVGSSPCNYCQGQPIPLPNPNDLNLIAEARKTLNTVELKRKFMFAINYWYWDGYFALIDASADKQLEAILRAHGKWKE